MLSSVMSFGNTGVNGFSVTAECMIIRGMPVFDIVGLADTAVKESRERVRSAFKSCGLSFPSGRVTVNLAPAALKKGGTSYDLPILLSILASAGFIEQPPSHWAFLGEVSLGGQLRRVSGVLPMVTEAQRAGIKRIFVPRPNAQEAALADCAEIVPVDDLPQLLSILRGELEPEIAKAPALPTAETAELADFSMVTGQYQARRALEIAAAGGHNVLMCGPPGSGKSLLASCLPSILPDMSRQELLETMKIHSVAGLLTDDAPLIKSRPFRSPHHTISSVGLTGGTQNLTPGEISLAHNGVLFLDELPEFPKSSIDSLRQPLESGEVTVSRVTGSVTYPSRFMLIAAMNPCRCGWFGNGDRCSCSMGSVDSYRRRISGPMLDRMDIFVDVPALEYDDLSRRKPGESSAEMRKRVQAAREIQRRRFDGHGIDCNAHMDVNMLRRFCVLDSDTSAIMASAFDYFRLTARAYDRVLRVARTIADLEGSESIRAAHIQETLSYRENLYTYY